MRLYLMRHGVAQNAPPGQSDAARALTPRGHERLSSQADALAFLGTRADWMRDPWRCDHLLTSPFTRAAESAAYVTRAFDRSAVPVARLASGADPSDYDDALAALDDLDERDHVWIVTHEPDLSRVIEHLTGARVEMRKGAIAVVETPKFARGAGTLVGLYDPDALAELAERSGLLAEDDAPDDSGAGSSARIATPDATEGDAGTDRPDTAGG